MTGKSKFSLEEIRELQEIVAEKIYYLPKDKKTEMRWRIWYILSNKKAMLL